MVEVKRLRFEDNPLGIVVGTKVVVVVHRAGEDMLPEETDQKVFVPVQLLGVGHSRFEVEIQQAGKQLVPDKDQEQLEVGREH
jgi:hypothetical protein